MVAHVRQLIRQAAATAVTGLTTTGTKVYQSRLHTLRDSNLPCLLVNTDDEDIRAELGAHERTLDLKIRAVAKATADLDDTLDTMAAEVEAELSYGIFISGKNLRITLTGIKVDMVDELEKPAGVLTLDYKVTYFTTSDAPQTIL